MERPTPSFNQVLAWTDPTVQISIEQQLLLTAAGEAGLINNLFTIILQYLTPLSHEEAKALLYATKPSIASEVKYLQVEVKKIKESLGKIYGKDAKNQYTETLSQAEELLNTDNILDTQAALVKVKPDEIAHFEMTQSLVGFIQNYDFWHKQLPFFASKDLKTVDFEIPGGKIKVPLFIQEMNACVAKHSDWKTNVKSMNAMRTELKSIMSSAGRGKYLLGRFGYDLNHIFVNLQANNTPLGGFSFSHFTDLKNTINKQKVSVSDTQRKLQDLTNNYVCQNPTEENMLNSLKACLRDESKSDEDSLVDIKKFAAELLKIKKEYKAPEKSKFQQFLKAAWDIVSLVLFPVGVYRAYQSNKKYNTCRFWKPELVRMRECAQDTVNQLHFQQPALFA